VTLQPETSGRTIDLGGTGDPTGTLQLSAAELNTITAGILRVGNSTAGNMTLTAAIAPTNASTLSLSSDGAIEQSGTGAVTVTKLAVQGAGGVFLGTNVNTVSTLAGATNNHDFHELNTSDLSTGTVDGVSGINTGASSNFTIISLDLVALNSLLTNTDPI